MPDPRPVPLSFFLSQRLSGKYTLSSPDSKENWEDVEGRTTVAFAVYVRVDATGDTPAIDPVNVPPNSSSDESLFLASVSTLKPAMGFGLPCAAPFRTKDREEISPPLPAYPAEESSMSPGETREGWLLCPSFSEQSDSTSFIWVIDDGSGNPESLPAWVPLARYPTAAWHLIQDATVVGWNDPESADESDRGFTPLPDKLPTPTSAVHGPGTEVVYRGPLWISIDPGISYARSSGETGEILGILFRARHAPGVCPGVAVWYRRQGIACHSNVEDRFGRLPIQFSFPGLEGAQNEWDHLALNEELGVDLYVQDSPDGLFAELEMVELQSRGSWIEADVPDEASRIWASVRSLDGLQLGPMPVWEITLQDAAVDRNDMAERVFTDHACLDPSRLSLTPSGQTDLHLDMPVPVLSLGESGNGVTPRRVRRIQEEIVVNDNLHGQDFLLRRLSDPWILIDIATVTDRAQRSFLLYPDEAGVFRTTPLEMVHYYEGSTGPLVVRYDAHAETRRGDKGFALLGTLPSRVPLKDVYLVMANTGPAWDLR